MCPFFNRSPIISRVKEARRVMDPRKARTSRQACSTSGPVRFKIARHFGFCYGVENAIEIAYRALEEHPEKAAAGRVFLLSEMIHNPHVNDDLQRRGIRFLRTTAGEQLIPFSELHSGDVVIIPAFGTTLEVEAELAARGVIPAAYDTTCPFVEKVWKKSAQIGKQHYTIVVHGKRYHEGDAGDDLARQAGRARRRRAGPGGGRRPGEGDPGGDLGRLLLRALPGSLLGRLRPPA